ncbi:Ubiquitin-protein ligase E3A (E6AP ubiquitin-protein ligase) (HECT-type ubiquitin transferase E3A) (Human papillomavirus E6-associated protein) (Oncogenic protein-associated protein E6-AP) (Renal carcinoma antigen NY-REN-54) [Durusdinium trenchii]|uniref:HECT-type E3 ubiquitin transferase n=1 Tax=Durusdinium trenchii TaxID=1381693 RepID=A0ABP0KBQ9_9DINO
MEAQVVAAVAESVRLRLSGSSSTALVGWLGGEEARARGRGTSEIAQPEDVELASMLRLSPQGVNEVFIPSGFSRIVQVCGTQDRLYLLTDAGDLLGVGDNTHRLVDPGPFAGASVDGVQHIDFPDFAKDKILEVACSTEHTVLLMQTGTVLTWGKDREVHAVSLPDMPAAVRCTERSTTLLSVQGRVFTLGDVGVGALGRGLSDCKSASGGSVSSGSGVKPKPKPKSKGGAAKKRLSASSVRSSLSTISTRFSRDSSTKSLGSSVGGLSDEALRVQSLLDGVPIDLIECGRLHCIAVTASGLVYGWGQNESLQVSRFEPREDLFVPVRVPLPERARLVSCGDAHTVYLLDSGAVYLASDQFHGKVPFFEVNSIDVHSIASSANQTLLMSTSGTIFSFVLDSGDGRRHRSKSSSKRGPVEVTVMRQPGTQTQAVFRIAMGGQGQCFALLSEDEGEVEKRREQPLETLGPHFAFRVSGQDLYLLAMQILEGGEAEASNSIEELHLNLVRLFSVPEVLASSFMLPAASQRGPLPAGPRSAPAPSTAGISVPLMEDGKVVLPVRSGDYEDVGAGTGAQDAEGADLLFGLGFGSGLDYDAISRMDAVVEVCNQTKSGLAKAVRVLMSRAVRGLVDSAQKVTEPDQLRPYLLLLVCPLLSHLALEEYAVLVQSIECFSTQIQSLFFRWIFLEIPADVLERNVVGPLARIVGSNLKPLISGTMKDEMMNTMHWYCDLLNCLFALNESRGACEIYGAANAEGFVIPRMIPREAFCAHGMSLMAEKDVLKLLLDWKKKGNEDGLLKDKVFLLLHDGGEAAAASVSATAAEAAVAAVGANVPAAAATGSLASRAKKRFSLRSVKSAGSGVGDGRPRRYSRAPASSFIFNYPFLFSVSFKSEMMRWEDNERRTRLQEYARIRGLGPRFILTVRRNHLLEDTQEKIANAVPFELAMPMLVIFEGEEGLDGGGVRKEFFQLLSLELFHPQRGMFVPVAGDKLWFNAEASDPESLRMFRLAGQLLGLSLYNSATLDVDFPLIMYRILLDALPEKLNVDQALRFLQELDPMHARGLHQMLHFEDDSVDFKEVFPFTFDNLKKHGDRIPVTMKNREQYVELTVEDLLIHSVAPMVSALREGFDGVFQTPLATFRILRPEELELIMTGSPDLDMDVLKSVTRYEGGYSQDHPTILAFWEVIAEMTPDQHRDLLRFVTGVPKVPIDGAESLRFTIQRAGVDSMQLPTASTCFNILLLPDYASKHKLRDRVLLATQNSGSGFFLR